MALQIGFDDILSQYDMEDVEREEREEREERMAAYKEAAVARADAKGQREFAEWQNGRMLFDGARKDMTSQDPGATAAGAAYFYPQRLATIDSYIANNKLVEAKNVYDRLVADASTHHTAHMAMASTQPQNDFERALQIGSQSLTQGRHIVHEAQLATGQKVTLGELFGGNGEGYKSYLRDSVLENVFDSSVADTYVGDPSTAKTRVIRGLVDPVMTATMNKGIHQYKNQVVDVANYVNSHWDELETSLGEDGLRRVVSSATELDNMTAGTSLDFIRHVAAWTTGQMTAAPDRNRNEVIRDAIGQYNRMLKSTADARGNVAPESARLVSRIMSAVSESSDGAVDFNNDSVRDAMDDVMATAATLSRLGVPFLPMAGEAGAPLRQAIVNRVRAAQYNEPVPVDNMYACLTRGVALVNQLVTGGGSPVEPTRSRDPRTGADSSANVLGATSGNPAIDQANAEVARVLLTSVVVPGIYKGLPETQALRNIISEGGGIDADVLDGISTGLTRTLGLSSSVAREAAIRAVRSMVSSDGSFVPLDLVDVIRRIGFGQGNPSPEVRGGAMRWFKTHGVASRVLQTFQPEIMAQIMDPVVGMGVRDSRQAQALWERYSQELASAMENGIDPSSQARVFARTGTVWMPRVRNGGLIYDVDGEPKTQKEILALMRGTGPLADAARNAPIWFDYYSGDLDQVAVPAVTLPNKSRLPGVTAGSFTRNRQGFIQWQRMIQQMVEAQRKAAEKNLGKGKAEDSLG